MRRQRWFELHDQPWFPRKLRDLVTEALEAVWDENRTYAPIAGRLRTLIEQAGTERVVDLCSGGGGPWAGLYAEVAGGRALAVCLTDRYPNARLRPAAGAKWLTVYPEPVDARAVPAELRGVRTIFSSFHHFDPADARAMLADAFGQREGIAVFEAAQRSAWTLLAVTAVPLLAWRAAARARPVQWRRIFWTFVAPVVPAVLWVDGVLSCLRSYSEADLGELTAGLSAPDYQWKVGEERGGRVPIRYLVGTPVPG